MKKILVAAAAGAMMFGLTAASASTLNLSESGWFTHSVQQSDAVGVTCTNKAVEVAIVANGIAVDGKGMVKEVDLLQQDVVGCRGHQAQVTAYMNNGAFFASNIVQIPSPPQGSKDAPDVRLTFANSMDPQKIESVRVTIADQIRP